MSDMFCFQCEQTALGKGCTKAGVCGKKSDTANFQDELTGALISLATAAKDKEHLKSTDVILLGGLFTTITNVNFNDSSIKERIKQANNEKKLYGSESANFDMHQIWNADEDVRSLKSLILFGLKGVAAYAYHAHVLSYDDSEINNFFYKALDALGRNSSAQDLLAIVMETGKINFKCMQLLDLANTKTYGTPKPVNVPLTVEKGPFIVITGHDLYDLKLLLEQTKDKGINIYTHGEMLPAHGYPELKAYKHLKGNFGTAWQNQQKEFDNIPAPVLFTTNCLMPVKDSYKDRVFTTEVVSYPEIVHIGQNKDFTPVIKKALELGGYKEDKVFTGINGGKQVTTGFGHGTVFIRCR